MMDELKKLAADKNIELTYSLGLAKQFDVSSADEGVRRGGPCICIKIKKHLSSRFA